MFSFKDIERKAGHYAGKFLDKGSDLVQTGKLKLAIGKEEHAIDELYYQIGKAVYDHYEDKSEAPIYLADFFEKVSERKERIVILESSLEKEEDEAEEDIEEFVVDITEEAEKTEE